MQKMLGRVGLRYLIGVFIAAGGFAAMKAYDQSQKRQQEEAPAPSSSSLLDSFTVASENHSSSRAHSRLSTAGTVGEFMLSCVANDTDRATNLCTHYLQGAIDQIAFDGSVSCVQELLTRPVVIDVWLHLDEMSKDNARNKDLLWGATRAAVYQSAPACAKS